MPQIQTLLKIFLTLLIDSASDMSVQRRLKFTILNIIRESTDTEALPILFVSSKMFS
jgi:hypothetical protein